MRRVRRLLTTLNQVETPCQHSRRYEDDQHAEPQESSPPRVEIRGDSVPRQAISDSQIPSARASTNGLSVVKVTLRRLHRAVVQTLYEMNELDVRCDVCAPGSDVVGSERLRRDHIAELVAEPLLNRLRE